MTNVDVDCGQYARLMNDVEDADGCHAYLSLCEDPQLRNILVWLAATRPSAKQHNRP